VPAYLYDADDVCDSPNTHLTDPSQCAEAASALGVAYQFFWTISTDGTAPAGGSSNFPQGCSCKSSGCAADRCEPLPNQRTPNPP